MTRARAALPRPAALLGVALMAGGAVVGGSTAAVASLEAAYLAPFPDVASVVAVVVTGSLAAAALILAGTFLRARRVPRPGALAVVGLPLAWTVVTVSIVPVSPLTWVVAGAMWAAWAVSLDSCRSPAA